MRREAPWASTGRRPMAGVSSARSSNGQRSSVFWRVRERWPSSVASSIDALADGSLSADEIKARLSAEKARKTALSTNLDKFGQVAGLTSMQVEQITSRLRTRIGDVAGLVGRRTVQARQMLRKILATRSSSSRSGLAVSGATSSGAS